MGDFFFSFTGRKKILGYWLSIICAVLAGYGVALFQQALGDWKFANVFLIPAAVIPIVVYLSATVRRFRDRGRHPLLGFLIYYILPAAVFVGAQQYLGEPLINMKTFANDIKTVPEIVAWTEQLIIKWGAISITALLFLLGQLNLFLMPSKKFEKTIEPAPASEAIANENT